MALSVVTDLNPGDVITDAWVDAVRINSNDYKTFAEGSAAFPGTQQKFGNDSNFLLNYNAGDPLLQFDANDYLLYARSVNQFRFHFGSTEKFTIDSGGLIQTAAFTSAEITITAGSTSNIAHGLGVKPRFFAGVYGVSTGASNCTRVLIHSFNSLGAFVRIREVDATNIVVENGGGVTVYVYVAGLR